MTTTSSPRIEPPEYSDPEHGDVADAATRLQRSDLLMFDLMHDAMRRGTAALRDALRDLTPLHRSGAAQLADYFSHMAAEIHTHHVVEDEVFFPAIEMTAPSMAAPLAALDRDHHGLDEAMESMHSALARLVRGGAMESDRLHAEQVAASLSALIDEHLDREEDIVFPCLLASFTRQRFVELDEAAATYVDRKEIPFAAAWLLAGATPERAAALMARSPMVARWLYRMRWKSRFERSYPLITGRSARRYRRLVGVVPLVLLGAVVAAAILGGCVADDGAGAAASSHGAHEAHAPDVVDVTLDDFVFRTSTAEVDAGRVTLRAHNLGREAHQLQIGRPDGELTATEIVRRWDEQGTGAAMSQIEWVGGPNMIEPGARTEAVSVLEPGEYVMVCVMPSPDGVAHVMKGMAATLTVSGDSERTSPPQPDETITVRDFAIDVPDGFRGQGLTELRNEGPQAHEVILMRLRDGQTLADLSEWDSGGQQGPAPFTFAGGVGTVEAGGRGWVRLDLKPGDYVAVCFVPDESNHHAEVPHVDLGMLTTFSI